MTSPSQPTSALQSTSALQPNSSGQTLSVSGLRLLVIGGGNMAQALVGGLLKSPACPLRAVTIVEPQAETRARLDALLRPLVQGDALGSGPAHGGRPALTIQAELLPSGPSPDWVLLAVKPQALDAVFQAYSAETRGWLAQGHLLSILAGTPMARLAAALGHARIVRAMPNTPALIGQGVTGLCAHDLVSAQARDQASALLAPAGPVVWLSDESQMNAVTALSGSGPAYVFLFQEALLTAGVALGLSPEQSRTLALQTLQGAAALMAQSAEAPEVLRARVTSPGGTTAAAIAAFDAGDFRGLVLKALTAARDRGIELGG